MQPFVYASGIIRQMGQKNHKIRDFIKQYYDTISVILAGLLLCIPVFLQIGTHIVGDDCDFHFWRIQAAVAGWQDGQIIPQVNPNMLSGFGYAQNLFYGPLITYFASVIFAVVRSWGVVYNLIFVGLMVISGYLMLITMRKISGNRRLALFAALFYLLAPYHIMRVFIANSLGEAVVFAIIPVLILGLWKLINQQKDAYIYLVIAVSVIILSHNLSIILLGLASVVFLLFNAKKVFNKEVGKQILIAAGITLILTAFFTVPLIEAKSIGVYAIFDQNYLETANHMSAELLNNTRAGIFDYLRPGFTRFPFIGITGVVAVLVFPFVGIKIKDKKRKGLLLSVYFVTILALIFTSKLIDWNYMPFLLRQMQFSWRFLMIFVAGAAILNGYILDYFWQKFDKKIMMALTVAGFCGILVAEGVFIAAFNNKYGAELGQTWAGIGTTAEYLPTKAIVSDDTNFENFSHNGFWTGAYNALNKTISEYNGTPKNFTKNGTKMEFEVDYSAGKQIVELPVFYYPGYTAKLLSEQIPATISQNGLLELDIPAEKSGRVEVYYGLSAGTKIGLIITITGVIVIIGVCLWRRKKTTN